MADEKPPFPEVKEYVRNYTFEKEHQDTYKKLLGAYSIKDRKADNRLHQQGRKKVLTDLDSMMSDVEAIEHEDHLYKVLGKILHKYDSAKVDVHNKTAAADKKKSKLDFNDLAYKRKVKELVDQYLRNNDGTSVDALINNIKEGNIETVVNQLLDFNHLIYQQEMAFHKMEEILPPNKDPNFYFKLANFGASKRQEEFTETDLRAIGANRDSLLKNMLIKDYGIFTNNALKKLKPEKKK